MHGPTAFDRTTPVTMSLSASGSHILTRPRYASFLIVKFRPFEQVGFSKFVGQKRGFRRSVLNPT